MHSRNITVKLLFGDSHGDVHEVAGYVQVIRKPKPEKYADFTISDDLAIWNKAIQLDEYVIHRLPSGRYIGIHSSVTLAEVIDLAIDRL